MIYMLVYVYRDTEGETMVENANTFVLISAKSYATCRHRQYVLWRRTIIRRYTIKVRVVWCLIVK